MVNGPHYFGACGKAALADRSTQQSHIVRVRAERQETEETGDPESPPLRHITYNPPLKGPSSSRQCHPGDLTSIYKS